MAFQWRTGPAPTVVWRSNYSHPDGWTFAIENEVVFEQGSQRYMDAFYLIVVDAEGYGKFNYFQEEFDVATHQAYHRWGVPEDSWIKTDDKEA